MASELSEAQRRAYIATSRRCQPIDELLRKARKGQRRGWRVTYAGAEGADLALAEDWYKGQEWRPRFAETFRVTYCSLCSTFAPVGTPVRHKPRCSANPNDDGPYPGWSVVSDPAGRLALEKHNEKENK